MRQNEALSTLKEIDKEIVQLSHIVGVLVWDQERIPPKAQKGRAEQIGLLEKKIHSLSSNEKIESVLDLLDENDSNLDDAQRALIRIRARHFEKSRKLSSEFVQKFSTLTSEAQQKWVQARSDNDFATFEPYLTQIVDMVKEKADSFGYENERYDALLDNYEEKTTTKEVELLFKDFEQELKKIIKSTASNKKVDDTFLYLSYPKDKQELFAKEVLEKIGFDFERGIVGVSTHPYTISLGSDDIRITTRYTEPSVASPLFSSIHEGGHALYEMLASNDVTRNSSLSGGASFAFHESQSRLWENMIARSYPFWNHFFPRFKELFPIQMEGVTLDTFVSSLNQIKNSLIRVDADEVTYNLHIIARFDLERALLNNELTVKELPEAWRAKYKEILDIDVPSDREGLLQDIHWSMGEFGYFPTYALGNLYAAQIMAKMKSEIEFDKSLEEGNFKPIRDFLEQHILRHGAIYRPKKLIERVCQNPLDASYMVSYLREKYLGEQR
jgi:carboxypeptidase Taq